MSTGYTRIIDSICATSLSELDAEKAARDFTKKAIELSVPVSVAESITGGKIASMMVKNPGASKVLREGIVAYSNEAKCANLGVKKETIEHCGAVSMQCCNEMLGGLSTRYTGVRIATTGIAGPASDEKNNPVGLVFIGWGINGRNFIKKFNFKGNRETIIMKTVAEAFTEALNFIQIKSEEE